MELYTIRKQQHVYKNKVLLVIRSDWLRETFLNTLTDQTITLRRKGGESLQRRAA